MKMRYVAILLALGVLVTTYMTFKTLSGMDDAFGVSFDEEDENEII